MLQYSTNAKKTNSKVTLITHGGLGNQLFQFLYALLAAELKEDNINIIHIDRYPHRFSLTPVLTKYARTNSYLMSRIRIGKFLEKMKINHGSIRIGEFILLDGYFQDCKAYTNFTGQDIKNAVDKIRSMFLLPIKNKGTLVHIRLGDFFGSLEEKKCAAINIMSQAQCEADIITNEEDIVKSLIESDFDRYHKFKVIETGSLNSYDVLMLMCQYNFVISNGSTLAFWAGILSNGSVTINNTVLEEIKREVFSV